MTLVYIAIPVSLLVAAGFLAAFIWAARDDQFHDLDTPPRRMLHDAPPLPREHERRGGSPRSTPESDGSQSRRDLKAGEGT